MLRRSAALVLVCFASTPAPAATWLVAPDGSGDFLTIQAGLAAATAGDDVVVAPGTYFETGLGLPDGVALRAQDPGTVTIDGEGAGRILMCVDLVDARSRLEGIRFYRGSSSQGGSIRCVRTKLQVSECTFEDNVLDCAFSIAADSDVELDNCSFVGNEGGVWADHSHLTIRGGQFEANSNHPVFGFQCRADFEGVAFIGNRASGGGAILFQGGEGGVANSHFEGNVAHRGGAILLNGGNYDLEDCVFRGNEAERDVAFGGQGGGVHSQGGSILIQRCRFDENRAVFGAGLCNFGFSGSFAVRDCVFRGNAASTAGGAAALIDSREETEVVGCLMAENRAAYWGGGVYVLDGSVTLNRCTLARNEAPIGSGLAVRSVNRASRIGSTHSIFSGGVIGEAVGVFDEPITVTPFECTNIFGNSGGNWTGAIQGQGGVNGNMSAAPLYCNPDALDYHLDWRSPCLPANSGGCDLIGAFGLGDCGTVTIQSETWARIKAGYR